MDPGFVMTHSYLAETYEFMDRFDDSMNELQEGIQLSAGQPPFQNLPPRSVYGQIGWKGYWQSALERAEKVIGSENAPDALFGRALICVRTGDTQKALEYLERAYQHRENSLILLQVHPLLDSLRRDPRYSELLTRMKLAP